MNRTLNMCALTLLFVLRAPAGVADEVQRTIEASSDGTVLISNVAGSIEVSGWSRNEVEVVADLGRGVEELVVERDGDDVTVKVRTPKSNSRNVSSDLIIRVPEMSAIDVGGVSADIEISDVLGEQRLNSVSGDVVTEAFGADVEAKSVSGDVELAGDDRQTFTRLTSVSGDIDAVRLAGVIEATAVSGDLAIEGGSFERVKANTVNGDLEFRAELLDGGKLDFETINGSVEVDFTGEVSARFDIETFNGSIRNCFGPKPERTSRYAPGRQLKFTEGTGSSRVTIRTLNGSLDLCRD